MTTTKEKTHWKKVFNYDYLGAYSLPEGKDMVLTIKELKKQKVKGGDGKSKECLVCYFSDADKPMILNKTNCRTLEKLYGTAYIEDWPGKRIQLYSTKVDAWGDVTDALRIRDTKPMARVDNREAIIAIHDCKTLEELQHTYKILSKEMKADPEVIALKDKLKNELK